MSKEIIYYIKKKEALKHETKLTYIVCFLFFGLLTAHQLELDLWSRWIYWDDVSSFVNTLHLSLFGLVVLFLFYDLLKKNTSSMLEAFLYFKEQLSEPLFGHKGPVASIIIIAMFCCFFLVPFLILFIFFLIWALIDLMISSVVSILLFPPFLTEQSNHVILWL